ncbi:DUF3343 domain-containing protein [Clostridium omnivorum]|uniref:Putative Se/S carrier protein-like domain-containing protein n=1 Tax=Clostridium omnivorum TaxID=1604902 RepID=A0ABQ5N5M9_9CLOT|nr:DUF3343 domain-containing protein [Clostridium sp. E14]GLC30451.1 hypothetical protein bsdE14_18610 [Clostridium sp. E14]
MDNYYLITFENTHSAMNAETILKQNSIKNIVMPTPTYITKSCGISLKFDKADLPTVAKLIKDESIKIKVVYLKEGSEFKAVEL